MRLGFKPIISDVGSACESQGDCSSTSRKTDTVINGIELKAQKQNQTPTDS